MLAEIGRRADFELMRATDVVHEGAHTTVLHCANFRHASSTRTWCGRWTKTRSGHWS